MKLVAALLFVVASVHANSLNYYGWAPAQEYVFQYESHVTRGIPEIKESHLAGVRLSSKVRVQSFSDFSLRVRVEEPRFLTLNGEVVLSETGRVIRKQNPESVKETIIPSQFRTHLTQPFLVHLKNGLVESVRVSTEEPVSVTNIKKSILAQIQLDIAATRRTELETNQIQIPASSEASDLVSYFTTSEESLQGECLTEYTIHKLPQWKITELEESWLLEQQEILGTTGASVPTGVKTECNGKPYFKVTKTKNLSQCKVHPVFYKATMLMPECDFTSSNCETLANHLTTTVAYICGELSEFKVRKTVTSDVISHSPLGYNTDEKVRTTSKVVLELLESKPVTQRIPLASTSSTKLISSLVYAYPQQATEQTLDAEIVRQTEELQGVRPVLPQPGLIEAPLSLIPIKLSTENIIREVIEELKKVAREVYQSPESCGCQSDLAAILTSITKSLRTLSLSSLEELERKVIEESKSGYKTIEEVFYDVLSNVGTNPSTMLVIRKIETGSLPTPILLKLVSQSIRNVRYPTQKLLGKLVQMVQSQTVKSNKPLLATSLLQLSNLFYHAYINPVSRITQFPTKVYGIFGTGSSTVLSEEYIPFLISQLHENESQYVRLVVISALGKLGHEKALEPLVKVPETLKPVAILSLKRIAKLHPAIVRPILMSVITNPVESPDVRIAAVSILPHANPTVAQLQRVAVISWLKHSVQVSSFISSTLRSLATTEIPSLKTIGLKAKSVLPLLKPIPVGIQHSHNINLSKAVEYLNMVVSNDIKLINAKNSLIPHLLSVETNYFTNAVKVPGSSITAYMINMDSILEKILHYIGQTAATTTNVSSQLSKIAAELKLTPRNIESPELYLEQSILGMDSAAFLNLNNVLETVDKVSSGISSMNGVEFSHASALEAGEMTAFGMTETGFPILTSISMPLVAAVKGSVTVQGQSEGETLAKVSAKIIPTFNFKLQTISGVVSPFTEELVANVVEGSIHSSIPVEMGLTITREALDVTIKTPEEIIRRGPVTEGLHAFITPYTAQQTLHTIKPISHDSSVKEIVSGINRQPLDIPIGQALGLTGRLIIESDAKLTDVMSYMQKISQHSPLSLLGSAILPSSVRKSSIKIDYHPSESETKEFNINIKLAGSTATSGSAGLLESLNHSEELNLVSSGLKNVLSRFVSSDQGSFAQLVKISASAKSVSQTKSIQTVIAVGKKSLSSKSVETMGAVEVVVPATGSTYGIRYEGKLVLPTLKYRWNIREQLTQPMDLSFVGKIVVGKPSQEMEVKIDTRMAKSQGLLRSVQESVEFKTCLAEIRMGRNLTPTCLLVQQQAASLDMISLSVQVPKVISRSTVASMLADVLKALTIGHLEYLPNSSSPVVSSATGPEMDLIKIEATADRLSELAQIVVKTPTGVPMKVSNLRLLGLTKTLFPLTILNDLSTVVTQKALGLEAPTACRVEPNLFTTFDNKTVRYTINDCEHVLVLDGSQKFPIGVLTKTLPGGVKTVKVLAGASVVEIVPESHHLKVLINGQVVPVAPGQVVEKTTDPTSTTGPVVIVKRYLDGVHLVRVPTQSLTVATNGVSIEVSAPQYLKSRAVGLCGDMNSEVSADLKTPRGCIMPSRLAAVSYMLNKSGKSTAFPTCSGLPAEIRDEFVREDSRCASEQTIPTPILSLYKRIHSHSKPTTRSHLVEVQGSQICVSKQMLKVCETTATSESVSSGRSMHGKPLSIKQLPVEFVCVDRTSGLSQSLKERALSGESLYLELNKLPVSFRKVVVEPVSCSQPSSSSSVEGAGSYAPSRW